MISPISVLANGFIQAKVKNGSQPFAVAWYRSDTTESINYFKEGTVIIGITYTPSAEKVAIEKDIAKSPAWYAWRDHFLLVEPPSNPANLSKASDIEIQFSNLYTAAEKGDTEPPVRFLTRYDKSATNIKDSQLWISIGQYFITDRGTFLSISRELQNYTTIYTAATDDPSDPLLNSAHIRIGKGAKNEKMADMFTQWAIGADGQKLITSFKKNGQQLYTGAPANKTAQF
ncbi:hypothetical protein N7539_006171 [Penicillium diatomitis]|uniref:PBP domain-containing protein n=1 Tax=Penicillium diatomitis TaxID=2819901 RepID=A0A9X0BSZ5_9EURO|nr:uncharacterized protein N7539_006171 [Penicillium diatomitis]KAJ5482725.1 hypothetical protein N7539_006171 [Penicillium diatomitis]